MPAQHQHSTDMQARCTPAYRSGSNGLVESRMKHIQSKCRTMRLSFEGRYKISIDSEHISWQCLARHSARTLNRYQLGANGRNAFFQLKAVNYQSDGRGAHVRADLEEQ